MLVRAFIITVDELFQAFLVERTYRLGEIPVEVWVVKVKHRRFKIFQDPWKDGVLRNILEASLCVRVQ